MGQRARQASAAYDWDSASLQVWESYLELLGCGAVVDRASFDLQRSKDIR